MTSRLSTLPGDLNNSIIDENFAYVRNAHGAGCFSPVWRCIWAAYNIAGGFGAAVSPIIAGLIMDRLDGFNFQLISQPLAAYHLFQCCEADFQQFVTNPSSVYPLHCVK